MITTGGSPPDPAPRAGVTELQDAAAAGEVPASLPPRPAALLVVQALLTAVSVVPVSRAAAARLGTGAGRLIGAAYGLSWGLQQMIYFDFHEIAFAVPLLACSLSALLRGKVRAAAVWALPLVFVKEDQG